MTHATSAGAETGVRRLLTINTGSSSLKASTYLVPAMRQDLSMRIERIGLERSRVVVGGADGQTLLDEQADMPRHADAMERLLDWLDGNGYASTLDGAGHRIVHGGPNYSQPQRISRPVLEAIRSLIPIDPDHLPQALAAIESLSDRLPALPQVACFDTAFHRVMPDVAQTLPLPRRFSESGVRRYGFHGLSYEYIVERLREIAPGEVEGRVIVAHLGNGASMVALRDGRSLDTTMGFTPTGGLVMSSRAGDLDPGVILYLLREAHLSPEETSALLNTNAGLVGVSGISGDMRDLLQRATEDDRAALAVELFCYSARKFIGALAAVLGGLETLVFTGGIGEHAATVRWRICEGLAFLGVAVDQARNSAHAAVVSGDDSRVTVRVMETDEDVMIARHTARVLAA